MCSSSSSLRPCAGLKAARHLARLLLQLVTSSQERPPAHCFRASRKLAGAESIRPGCALKCFPRSKTGSVPFHDPSDQVGLSVTVEN